MKRILVAGALILSLAACGGNNAGGGGGTVDPVLPNAYNPDASATESTDPRIPYQGDWVWAARLSNGSYQVGVLSIATRGQPTNEAKNGGVGANAQCSDDTCTTKSAATFGLILSEISEGQAQLGVIFGNRLSFTDSDGKVTLNAQGRPVISGAGQLANDAGAVRVALVQVNADANTEGNLDVTVPAGLFDQARAAADAVTAQAVRPLPSIDVAPILR